MIRSNFILISYHIFHYHTETKLLCLTFFFTFCSNNLKYLLLTILNADQAHLIKVYVFLFIGRVGEWEREWEKQEKSEWRRGEIPSLSLDSLSKYPQQLKQEPGTPSTSAMWVMVPKYWPIIYCFLACNWIKSRGGIQSQTLQCIRCGVWQVAV